MAGYYETSEMKAVKKVIRKEVLQNDCKTGRLEHSGRIPFTKCLQMVPKLPIRAIWGAFGWIWTCWVRNDPKWYQNLSSGPSEWPWAKTLQNCTKTNPLGHLCDLRADLRTQRDKMSPLSNPSRSLRATKEKMSPLRNPFRGFRTSKVTKCHH